MLSTLLSAAILGVDAYPVQVEVDVSFGLPAFTMVGLPDPSVRESRDRVRSAIRNSGFEFPQHRITINLAPADLKKGGSSFDLPIALGLLAATGTVERREIRDLVVLGELSLDGAIQPARGVLPVAAAARRARISGMLLPRANLAEASVVRDLKLYGVESLAGAVAILNAPPTQGDEAARPTLPPAPPAGGADFADVRGQNLAKRALEIAAAGAHNVLLVGPPGAGKTMMAKRMPGILPPLTFDEALEAAAIHSVAGTLAPGTGLLAHRPFRAPHHTITEVALVGGGVVPRPGEISLAHNGVLFLDEMPEFERRVLEVLRQPLEDGYVTIARAARAVVFPARFMLVAAMNPCPCGHLGNPQRICRCSPPEVDRYHGRLSGPLKDRIDLIVEVPALRPGELGPSGPGGPTSADIRDRVVAARRRQAERGSGWTARSNAVLHGRALWRDCRLDAAGLRLLEAAVQQLGLSARGHDRVLRVARTVADLDGRDHVESPHVAEALQYRSRE